MTVFSRRHRRALANDELRVEISTRLAGRVARLLERYNVSWSYQPDPGDSWTESTDAVRELTNDLLDLTGKEALTVPVGVVRDEQVDGLGYVRKGPAIAVLDAVELFLAYVDDRAGAFAQEVNRVFSEEDSVWRLLGGEFVPLDSVFVHEQSVARAHERLGAVGWEGAAQELLDAQHDLADGAGRKAVHHAGTSVESTLKAALGRDDGSSAALTKALADEGWLDDLPEHLREGFVQNVLASLPWMRNRLGGHGQGRAPQPVAEPYARLAIGIAAAVNEFLVALALARGAAAEPAPAHRELVPTIPSPDDDIPF